MTRDSRENLLDPVFCESLFIAMRDFKKGDFLLVTPSCSTYSRATAANTFGPAPVRDFDYPDGFPWLEGKAKERADAGAVLVQKSKELIREAIRLQLDWILEFPEDLGRRSNGIRPASIFQDDTFVAEVRAAGATSRAFSGANGTTSQRASRPVWLRVSPISGITQLPPQTTPGTL